MLSIQMSANMIGILPLCIYRQFPVKIQYVGNQFSIQNSSKLIFLYTSHHYYLSKNSLQNFPKCHLLVLQFSILPQSCYLVCDTTGIMQSRTSVQSMDSSYSDLSSLIHQTMEHSHSLMPYCDSVVMIWKVNRHGLCAAKVAAIPRTSLLDNWLLSQHVVCVVFISSLTLSVFICI